MTYIRKVYYSVNSLAPATVENLYSALDTTRAYVDETTASATAGPPESNSFSVAIIDLAPRKSMSSWWTNRTLNFALHSSCICSRRPNHKFASNSVFSNYAFKHKSCYR